MSRIIAFFFDVWESLCRFKWADVEYSGMNHRPARAVQLRVDDAPLDGRLTIPPEATALIVLVNGQWGIRYASRETEVAAALRDRGFGTLLVELLTPEEDGDRDSRFAIDLHASRLAGVTDWLDRQHRTADMPRGFLGVGPGVATALRAVSDHGSESGAVVGVDGRADLGADALAATPVPTLLLVDTDRAHLVRSHTEAYDDFDESAHRHVVVRSVVGADGTASTDVVALASDWFRAHLSR
jgi:putative phosphoribosyl transferase